MKERLSNFFAGTLAAALYIGLAVVLAAVMLTPRASAASETEETKIVISSWAEGEMAQAEELGLITSYFVDANNGVQDYTAPITRRDFCVLATNYVKLQNHFDVDFWFFNGMMAYYKYEKHQIQGDYVHVFIDELPEYPYSDIYTAYYLGIALGDENRAFNGDSLIARQEAAAMLVRAYQACGGELPQEAAEISFADAALISDWAKENASALSLWGVMKGDENGNFNPTGQCSYEQAIAMFLRLYNSAPVSRVNGNVQPIFTYEQCLEWLDHQNHLYKTSTQTEGNGVTLVRYDISGIPHPCSMLLLVFHDGGIRQIEHGIPGPGFGNRNFSLSALVENIQFSPDGKTCSCTVSIGTSYADDGTPLTMTVYQLTVDMDTMACSTVEISAPA